MKRKQEISNQGMLKERAVYSGMAGPALGFNTLGKVMYLVWYYMYCTP